MLTSSTISLLEKTERPTTCLSATSHSASSGVIMPTFAMPSPTAASVTAQPTARTDATAMLATIGPESSPLQ